MKSLRQFARTAALAVGTLGASSGRSEQQVLAEGQNPKTAPENPDTISNVAFERDAQRISVEMTRLGFEEYVPDQLQSEQEVNGGDSDSTQPALGSVAERGPRRPHMRFFRYNGINLPEGTDSVVCMISGDAGGYSADIEAEPRNPQLSYRSGQTTLDEVLKGVEEW